jgi:membrane protein YqaA with SNARE-associated domain
MSTKPQTVHPYTAALGSIPSPKRRFGFNFALCLIATTAVATAGFLWLGLTPVTAALAAVALGCPLAALYAWWLGRRALRAVERAGIENTPEKRGDLTRRTP